MTHRHRRLPSLRALTALLLGIVIPAAALQSAVTTYRYDELGRLVQVSDTRNTNQGYAYDAAGNRRSMVSQVGGSGGNRAPVATADSYTVRISVQTIVYPLLNDSDPDGDAIALVAVTQPANATVTINSGNSLSIVGTSAAAGSFQDGTFTYTISDGRGGTSSATVSLRVLGERLGGGR